MIGRETLTNVPVDRLVHPDSDAPYANVQRANWKAFVAAVASIAETGHA
ncbi:MAG: hypothetical protein WBQ26_09765 [Gemmatimonadaceae bacterium]